MEEAEETREPGLPLMVPFEVVHKYVNPAPLVLPVPSRATVPMVQVISAGGVATAVGTAVF